MQLKQQAMPRTNNHSHSKRRNNKQQTSRQDKKHRHTGT